MSYRRRSNPFFNDSYGNNKTKVTIHWSPVSSAYAIKFNDMRHYQLMVPMLNYMKSKPYGEYQYDPENKIWYLMEQHIEDLRVLLDTLKEYFEVDFVEKQENNSFTPTVIPVGTYLDRFKSITGHDIKNLPYEDAKKVYRRVAMSNHPDRGGNVDTMSSINEIWSNLEKNLYNIKKEQSYENI